MNLHNICNLFCLKQVKAIFYICSTIDKPNQQKQTNKKPASKNLIYTAFPNYDVQTSSHMWEIK